MIKQKLHDFLAELLSTSEIEDDTALIDLGYMDSMQALTLATFVSDEFQIALDQDDMRIENFASVDAVEKFVQSKGAAG